MKKYIIGIIVLWMGIFSYMIIPQYIQTSFPDDYPRIILKTQPVDPRDLLRGDFVVLSYDFSRVSWTEDELSGFPAELKEYFETSNPGEEVFVSFSVADDRRATPVSISSVKPDSGIFLRGKTSGRRDWNRTIKFGIEKYFVPQGKGKELEKARNAEELEVEVAVDPKSGKALITDLLLKATSVDFSEIKADF